MLGLETAEAQATATAISGVMGFFIVAIILYFTK